MPGGAFRSIQAVRLGVNLFKTLIVRATLSTFSSEVLPGFPGAARVTCEVETNLSMSLLPLLLPLCVGMKKRPFFLPVNGEV